MAKKPSKIMMMRLQADQLEALRRAGEDESLAPSTLARVITVEWLRRHGYLPKKSRQERG